MLIVIILFSGCVQLHNHNKTKNQNLNQNTNNENIKKNNTQTKINKLTCDDNNPCTTDYIKNNICYHEINTECIAMQDKTKNTEIFKNKIKSCNFDLKDKNIKNNCNQSNIDDKLICIENLTHKIKDINCCYLIANNYNDLNNSNIKITLNKCKMDYVINQKDPKECFNTINPKECFVCYLKNTHLNIFENSICKGLNQDKNEFCNSALLSDFKYCNNIKDASLKNECVTTDVSQNNCVYYNFDKPKTGIKQQITNKNEFLKNTTTRLEFYKRQKIDENNIFDLEKQNNAYKFVFNDSINPNVKLDKCQTNTKSISIDYNNYKYSTFYFTYKNYQFIYSIKVFDDFYNYSKELATQYCYDFNEDTYYQRYLDDKLNDALLQKIADDFSNLQNYGFNKNEIAEIVVRFVQEIPYNYNWEKTNVYPYSVIWEMKGVCLDKSVILAQILKDLGYETYIITGIANYTESKLNHALVGVTCNDSNVVYNNKKICLIESTSPSLINEHTIDKNMKFSKLSSGKKYIEDSYGPKKVKELKQDESKMTDLKSQIDELKNKSNWKEYNRLVVQYNDLLYKTLGIRFLVYE